ncbi:MAG: hypothetical protein ACYTF9_08895 [Planctomycetota bacterium]|jgi:DNA-binding transcriptional regulator LsrR (DeoR family)
MSHDTVERISLVCRYFCAGHVAGEIKDLLAENHGVGIHREQVYRDISQAAKQGWIRYAPPPEYDLRDRIKVRYDWLERVAVVHTATINDVAAQTAQMLVDLLRDRANQANRRKSKSANPKPTSVSIGFAGGHAMRLVAVKLRELLRAPAEGMPDIIKFHALVAGFSYDNPMTDPNSFINVFADERALPMESRFVALLAPPVVNDNQFPTLKKLHAIEEAFKRRKDIDIIVTSGGSWEGRCRHSMLHDVMKLQPESMDALENEDCCGDMMWRPIGPDGPITKRTKTRAMTLLELTDLPALRLEGKSILFMLGPCRVCDAPRANLLKTILNFNEHLVTHVVTDSRTAAELVAETR